MKLEDKRNVILNKGKKLNNFTKNNTDTSHINHQIYHLLLDPFTLDNAYTNLSRNKGSFTNGVNVGNIQGYSRSTSIEISNKLKQRKFKPNPVRRVWVPKPNKKEKRPLGIPTFQDRVVQEAIRGILEAIYEPEFAKFAKTSMVCNNFGFRPQLNCWQAIEHFKKWGQQITFVIEGDIKGAYNNVDHEILINILSKRIKDKNF